MDIINICLYFCILYFVHLAVPMRISAMGNSGRFLKEKPAAQH